VAGAMGQRYTREPSNFGRAFSTFIFLERTIKNHIDGTCTTLSWTWVL
jgi:hypothetical protein